MNTPLKKLAALGFSWQSRPLDEAVATAVRQAVLDWFAATLPGTLCPPASCLAGRDMGTGSGRAICFT